MITLKNSLLWGRGDRKCLAGCTELTATYNAKELHQSQTVWANKMNSLWLPPACDARNTVSSAQTEKSLLGTANKGSRDLGLPGQRPVPVAWLNQTYCQDHGLALWKPCRSQRPDDSSTAKGNGEMHLPMSYSLLPSLLNKEQGYG